ncbi:MAG: DUF58 domain-containing protein [Oscillospiraceae bacterium]|nr:DUF58 domain-containing protein [Oscillospiraceae bacterium]
MLKYRLIYTFTLSAVFIFYLLYTPWFSWFLLLAVLFLVPLDLVISLPGMFTKTVAISAPIVLEKGERGAITITAIDKKPFPIRCLNVIMSVTGDGFTAKCKVICAAKSGDRSQISIDTSQTGLMVFKLKKLYAVSLLGLFSREIKPGSKVSVLVLPRPLKPEGIFSLPRELSLVPKPGGGFSEEHDMREYRQGDSVRSIHWKLSAKHDSLIVREPLVPKTQSRLLHIKPWGEAAERDFTLSYLRWICDYLLMYGLSFHVKYGDMRYIREIYREADLVEFLRHVLDRDNAAVNVYTPVPARFAWVCTVSGLPSRTHAESADDMSRMFSEGMAW